MPGLRLNPVQVRRGTPQRRSPFAGVRSFADGEATPVDQASPAPSRVRAQLPTPPEYVGDPIHMTASVVGLNAGSSGAGVNVKALRNPGPGAIEIFGIKFRLRSSQPITGALVGCRLDLGDFQLTNGFVPLYAFGRAENLLAEQTSDGASPPAACYTEYICRLSRPIYVPLGAVVRPQLQHKGLTSATVDVHISMFGRMLPEDAPLPDRLLLPYWAAYVSKTFQAGTVDSDASTESDLANPFDVPLRMERFVGRISMFSGAALTFAASMIELENNPFGFSSGSFPTFGDIPTQISCSIIDSNGYPVVKRLTPFRLVFDAETRSWPVTHELPAGGYYLINMANAAWISGNPFTSAVFVQPCISMLGWREVA